MLISMLYTTGVFFFVFTQSFNLDVTMSYLSLCRPQMAEKHENPFHYVTNTYKGKDTYVSQ